MTEKLVKLLDLAAEALSLYIRKTSAELGESLLDKPAAPKERKARTTKAEPAAATKTEPESPFGDLGKKEPGEAVVASIEDQAESKRRCTEVMGLFIRRHLKAQPSGLDRAKGILKTTLGREIGKLEDLTHADNVKLIPVFEAELEKAA